MSTSDNLLPDVFLQTKNNNWHTLDAFSPELESVNVVVPFDQWPRWRSTHFPAKLALQIQPENDVESIKDDFSLFDEIWLHFRSFSDGRPYSIATTLRKHFGYEGDLRATGEVLVDQVQAMAKCGFNAIELRQDQSLEKAKLILAQRLNSYQHIERSTPLMFRP